MLLQVSHFLLELGVDNYVNPWYKVREEIYFKGGITMTLIRKVLLLVCGLMLVFSLAACEKKGPVQKAGEKVDNAIEKAGDKVKEKTEK
jgi:predicted small lipoprotein YifL